MAINKKAWTLFLIWPCLAFIIALNNILNKEWQKIIIAFSFLFGYSVYLYGGDILNYEESFYLVKNYSFYDYFYLLTHPLSSNKLDLYIPNTVNAQPDIYALSLQFFISRFTDNPRWFWGIVSVIYTSLFLSFINELDTQVNWLKNNKAQKIFFIFLLVLIPFYVGVTGVRFWTALFYFMICLLRYIKDSNVKQIFWASLTIFIHYAFIVPIGIILLYHFLPKKKWFFKIGIFISIVVFLLSSTGGVLGSINKYADSFDQTTVGSRVDSYTDTDSLAERKEMTSKTNWYVKARADLILFFLLIVVLIEALGVWKFNENKFLKAQFPIIIIFFCITLLTYNLGSVGRFKNIFYLLVLLRYIILVGLNPYDLKLKLCANILLPILILYIVVICRAGFYFIDPFLLINNIWSIFILKAEMSLSQLIIGH